MSDDEFDEETNDETDGAAEALPSMDPPDDSEIDEAIAARRRWEDSGEIDDDDWITGPVRAVVAVGPFANPCVLAIDASREEEGEASDYDWVSGAIDLPIGGERDAAGAPNCDFDFDCPDQPGIWLLTGRFYVHPHVPWDYVQLEPPRRLASLADLLAGKTIG